MEHSTDSILTQAPRVPGVAYLPTAGLAPVKNAPRRGRLPQGVVAIRAKPAAAVAVVGEEPIDPLDATYRMLDMIQCTLDLTRRRLAEYEKAQRRTG